MHDDATLMNRYSLRFADAGLEASFAEEQALKAKRHLRIIVPWSAGIMVIMWALAGVIIPDVPDVHMRIAVPVIAALGALALWYALLDTPLFLRFHQLVSMTFMCIVSAAAVGFGLLTPRAAFLPISYLLVIINTFSTYANARLRFPAAVASAWLSALMYLGYLGATGILTGSIFWNNAFALIAVNAFGMLVCYQLDLLVRREFLALRDVAVERERSEREHERSERLLHNILPVELAEELSRTGVARPAKHDSATILFTDFSGFTQVASAMPADRMVAELNEIFGAFDDICDELRVEKIKTIGDAYMAAAGLPKPCSDHAQRCVRAGLRMLDYLAERNRKAAFKWSLRVGVHSGPVVTGVVGKRKYAFDVWGDTVNIASRMEGAGEAGRVNVSAYTYDLIRTEFECEYRGKVDAKGKGQIDMYFVKGSLAQ